MQNSQREWVPLGPYIDESLWNHVSQSWTCACGLCLIYLRVSHVYTGVIQGLWQRVVRCNPDRVGCRRLVYLAHFRKRHHSWTVVHGTRMKRLIRDRHDFCKRWTVCFSHIFWTSLAAFWDEGNRNTAEWSMEEWSVRYQTGTAWDVADFLRLHLANKWALLVLFWIRSFHVCFKSENRLSGDWCDWILGFLRFLLVVPGCQGKGERLEAGIQKTSALQVAFLIFSMILCLSAVETCGNMWKHVETMVF